MTDVEKSLAQVVSAAKRLNEKSDSITETIRRVENALRESNAGVEFQYQSALARGDEMSSFLRYTKHEGKWCLMVRVYRDVPNEEEKALFQDVDEARGWESVVEDEMPLLQGSRTIRIKALAQLPDFLDGYRRELESAVKTIEKAEEALK